MTCLPPEQARVSRKWVTGECVVAYAAQVGILPLGLIDEVGQLAGEDLGGHGLVWQRGSIGRQAGGRGG